MCCSPAVMSSKRQTGRSRQVVDMKASVRLRVLPLPGAYGIRPREILDSCLIQCIPSHIHSSPLSYGTSLPKLCPLSRRQNEQNGTALYRRRNGGRGNVGGSRGGETSFVQSSIR